MNYIMVQMHFFSAKYGIIKSIYSHPIKHLRDIQEIILFLGNPQDKQETKVPGNIFYFN